MSKGQIKSWSYETETYEFHAIKKGARFYSPDFIIVNMDDSIERQELKGYMDPRSATKLARMKLYYPDAPITLIEQKQYYAVAAKVASFIPHWESR